MGGANCFALAWPRQTESLAAVLDVDVEDGLEGVEVDLAVGYYFGKSSASLSDASVAKSGVVRGTSLSSLVIACSIGS